MGKALKLTEDKIQEALMEFYESIKSAKGYDDVSGFKIKFPDEKKEAILRFEWAAYLKMQMLVQGFNSEVGWHGICHKVYEDEIPVYIVSDIMVYPQQVTGVTTTTDQKEYEDWLYSLDEEQFNGNRFHGHSHVNMGTTPSSTDMAHRRGILSEFVEHDFYVFVIWNKSNESNITIYDEDENYIFENKDVALEVVGEEMDLLEKFLKDGKELVKRHTYTSSATIKRDTPSKAKGVKKTESYSACGYYDYDDDEDDDVPPAYYGQGVNTIPNGNPYGPFGYCDGPYSGYY